MDETPRQTNLYRKIAKDYSPKQAEMKICKYIEALETRIAELESRIDAPKPQPAPSPEPNAAVTATAQATEPEPEPDTAEDTKKNTKKGDKS